MKRKLLSAVATGLVAGVLASASAQAETTLRLSSWIPKGHPIYTDMIKPWADDVEQATKGNVKIQILPKALGSPPQHFDLAKDGLADITYSFHGYTPGRFILTKASELPFTGDSAEAISVAYWRIHNTMLAKANEHRGVKVIGLMNHGPGHPHTVTKQINSIADFKGMKFRVGGGVMGDVSKILGVVGILKPAPKAYELLSNKVVDGVFFPYESMVNFNLARLTEHSTYVPGGLYAGTFFLAMNPRSFDGLSDADRTALESVSGEYWARKAGKAWDKANTAGVEALKEKGVKVETASPQLMAELQEALAPIRSGWIKEAGKRGVDGNKVLDALSAEIKKVEAEMK